jgi:hypothetical protein
MNGLSIRSPYGNPRFVVRSAFTRYTQDGRVGEQGAGFRFRFRKWGKWRDPDTDEVVAGIRSPGLAHASKVRRNRALSELTLAQAVEDAQNHGVEEFQTEQDVLDYFLRKYGNRRGIDWNVYDVRTGQLVADEDLLPQKITTAPPATGTIGAARSAMDPADFDDTEFIVKDSEGFWECRACGWRNKLGVQGHRRAKKHRENVFAAQKVNKM